MNQPLLLHIVERLETFLGKLPETIQRPILSEVTPLKELFLQQRPPRFLFTGSSRMPMPEIIRALFSPVAEEQMSVAVMPVHRWADWNIQGHGTISILDARDADDSAEAQVKEELRHQPADIIFFIDYVEKGRSLDKDDLEKLLASIDWSGAPVEAKLVAIWRDLLGVSDVGINDNFFDLGGDSLVAIRVLSRCRDEFKVDQTLASLFEHPTVSQLAHQIVTLRKTQHEAASTAEVRERIVL